MEVFTMRWLSAIDASFLESSSDTVTKHFTPILILNAKQTRNGIRQPYQINANVNSYFTPLNETIILCSGKHCLNPPIPDDKYKLSLDPTYDPNSPRGIDSAARYYCNTTAVAGTTHWNRRLNNFDKNYYDVKCQEKNTWAAQDWPTCVPSMSMDQDHELFMTIIV